LKSKAERTSVAEIFVSYASDDRPTAQMLSRWLETQGWSVWWDRKIPAGKTFDTVISQQLAAAKCVLVLWSERSVDSDWVKEEATEAARRKILVPVLIDGAQIPLGFRRIQAAHLAGWDGQSNDINLSTLRESIAMLLGEAAEERTGTYARARESMADGAERVRSKAPVAGGSTWSQRHPALVATCIVVLSVLIGYGSGAVAYGLTGSHPLGFTVLGIIWSLGMWLAWYVRRRLKRTR
jgi:TIR domain